MKKHHRKIAMGTGLLLSLVAGCLPIELSVSPEGRILIPRQEGFFAFDPGRGKVEFLYMPSEGDPCFGLYGSDTNRILAVNQSKNGMIGVAFGVDLVELSSGKPIHLLEASNITYLQWSPNGRYVSLTRVSDSEKPPFEENMPELMIANVESRARRTVAWNTSVEHRWLPDSSALILLQLKSKEEGDNYVASLVRIPTTNETGEQDSGEETQEPAADILAEVVTGKEFNMSVSPDGRKVLFTAISAVKPGREAPLPSMEMTKPEPSLFELNLYSGDLRQVGRNIYYAKYSPGGDRVLLGQRKEENGVIKVTDADFNKESVLAQDAAYTVSESLGPGTDIYPSWLDNKRIIYLAQVQAYGTAGMNLNLVELQADGSGSRNLQAAIDAGVLSSE